MEPQQPKVLPLPPDLAQPHELQLLHVENRFSSARAMAFPHELQPQPLLQPQRVWQ